MKNREKSQSELSFIKDNTIFNGSMGENDFTNMPQADPASQIQVEDNEARQIMAQLQVSFKLAN